MKNLLLICFTLVLTFSSLGQQTEHILSLKEQIESASNNSRNKANLYQKLFDLYFSNNTSKGKEKYKSEALSAANKGLKISEKINYANGKLKGYKNLSSYYKFFNNKTKHLKYELKYQQKRVELKKAIEKEEEEAKRKHLEKLRLETIKKEREIKELEKDKILNKDLIEEKKKELESANLKLDKSRSKIIEKESEISASKDTILKQSILNDKLKYQNRILEDEKKIIALREKAATAKNLQYLLAGVLGIIVAIFFLVFTINLRRTKKKLQEKNAQIEKEKARSDELLLNILPYETAKELKEKGKTEAQKFDNVTVFFSDFKDFTKISEQLSPSELVEEIDHCFKAFDRIIEKYDIEKIKTVGDAYICASGLNHNKEGCAEQIIEAAIEIRDFIDDLVKKRKKENKLFFEVRIGVHTGPIVAGIVGFKKFAYDIWGDTVNTAARMEEMSEPGKINISAQTFEKVKSLFSFTYRGKIAAKNKGEIDMYFINNKI